MITEQALIDTINYFYTRKYSDINCVIYLHKDDFLFRPEVIGEVIYLDKYNSVKGYVSFDMRFLNGDYMVIRLPLLTNEERIIKEIIE